jgi:hypothetical protein
MVEPVVMVGPLVMEPMIVTRSLWSLRGAHGRCGEPVVVTGETLVMGGACNCYREPVIVMAGSLWSLWLEPMVITVEPMVVTGSL